MRTQTFPRLGVKAVALIVAGTTLAWSSAASAKLVKYGSLGKRANYAISHGADVAYWPTAQPNGAPTTVRVSGYIHTFRIRGCAEIGPLDSTPLTQIHFQTLDPGADGSVKVFESTSPFNMPVCGQGGASAATVTKFYLPLSLCVSPGDYVDINSEGGNTPFDVFAQTPGWTTTFFTGNNLTDNGDTLTPTELTNVRLLMQVIVDTKGWQKICH
jgi:hypothetical protein